MKVALVLPPHTFEDRYNKSIAKAAGVLPPLGLLYIASVVREGGHEVAVLDGSVKDFYEINQRLDEFKPDIIGINVMTFLWDKVKKWLPELKQRFPGVFIIVGGAHPSVIKEGCLRESEHIDGIITGEAEYLMLELANNLENKKPLNEVKGLIYRDNDKIITNVPNERISDLDKIPFPARDLIDLNDYVPAPEQYKRLPVTNIITTRGCPYLCTFCATSRTAPKYRSPENVVGEMKELVEKYGIRDIAIWDDTFTLNKKRVLEICRLIIESKLDVIWCAHSRINLVDRELLETMSKAGCWKVFFGAESMIQKNLDTIKKGLKVEEIFNAINLCKKFGIDSECSFMFGIPGETYEDALQTIKLVKQLDPDYAKFFPITPMPGTEFYEEGVKHGTIDGNIESRTTGNYVVYVPNSMKKEEMEKIVPLAYKEFYLRPKYIFKYAKKIRSLDDVKRAWRGASAVLAL